MFSERSTVSIAMRTGMQRRALQYAWLSVCWSLQVDAYGVHVLISLFFAAPPSLVRTSSKGASIVFGCIVRRSIAGHWLWLRSTLFGIIVSTVTYAFGRVLNGTFSSNNTQ